MRTLIFSLLLISVCLPVGDLCAADKVPPYDLWTPEVLAQIRDRSTLNHEITLRPGYADVFFTSNPSAGWYDAEPPYAVHRNGSIRIHAYLAVPASAGPFPALVIGHGHGGQADLSLASQVAGFGYVALAIDGPMAGQSAGGPKDHNQAWISVDDGPEYGYLYHYAYAGMRALTLLEELSQAPGNPYKIDASRLGVLGASMGGILTSIINGIDDRVKTAIVLAAAGQWQHSMRFPGSWLYHGLYTGTRDQPYNGADPPNSVEDIDTDPTAITFMNYFDPIRYTPRQHAPVLVIVGTHDGYFPLTCANQMALGIASAGTHDNFEKRLWLFPNARHGLLDNPLQLFQLVTPLLQWLDYSFGKRDKPLAEPQVAMSQDPAGLRFEIALGEPSSRLAGASASLHAATRVDANVTSIQDFRRYTCNLQGDKFVTVIPSGDRPATGDAYSAGNVIYYATVTDAGQLPVSSLVYRAGRILDLSSDFVPGIDPYEGSSVVVPVPPPRMDAASTVASSVPVPDGAAYQGMSLANPDDSVMTLRMEARGADGRLKAADGLINPVFMNLAPRSQRIFLAEEWMGAGARRLDGAFRFGWSGVRAASLAFRGNVAPAELSEIGPLAEPGTRLWLPLAWEQDPGGARRIRIFAAGGASGVTVDFRNKAGTVVSTQTADLPALGGADLVPPQGQGLQEPALADIRASAPVSARLEVTGSGDPWSIEARAAPAAGKYIQPHVEWNGVFRTLLLLVNPSSESRDLVLRLRSASGTSVVPEASLKVAGYGIESRTVESIFGIAAPTPAGAGWVEVEGIGGPVLVTALAADPLSGAAAASVLLQAGAGTWSMPFFVEDAGYWTGLAILNPTDSPVTIEFSAYKPDGTLIARVPLTLEGRQGRTQLVSQWIPSLPSVSTGRIVLSAQGNVSLLAYFGTDDGESLAAIPFSRVPP
ncbi:MAG: prolyl oligopeptidase family serine peptidase [Acidobacteria bacterium]|nr:prolyl oligopeptidase family serine peptidase [Acidobacteriota bacterium]